MCLKHSDWEKFDTFVREKLSEVLPVLQFPSDGSTVFDVFIDCQRRGSCVRWNERPLEKSHSFPLSSSYVVIPEVFSSLL